MKGEFVVQKLSKFKIAIGLMVLMAVAIFGYKGAHEVFQDKSVVPASAWRDSGSEFPPVKWIFHGLGETLNVYGYTLLDLAQGDFDILKLEGMFPNSRYFGISLHTQDMKQESHNLIDHQIIPDEGYVNPFVVGNERKRGQKYSVYLVREGVKIDPSLRNVLVIPDYFTTVALATRQYRADDDTPLRKVARPYPIVTAFHEDMTRGIAPVSTRRIPLDVLNDIDFNEFEESYDRHHAFQVNNGRPNSIDFLPYGGDGMGPNNDNKYIIGTLGGDFAKVAVVGIAKAPTYEKTRHREPFTGGKNVRYWSFCHAEGRMGMVNHCVNDDRMKYNTDGSVTLIVGPKSIKAEVERAGLTWLPWTRSRTFLKPFMKAMYGGNKTHLPERLEKKTMLVFRQVLADGDWSGSISNQVGTYYQFHEANGAFAFNPDMDERAEVMLGEAGPRGVVLDVETFRKGLKKGDFNKAFTSNYTYTDEMTSSN